MIARLFIGIFVVAAFLCFPISVIELNLFFSMLMMVYLASIVSGTIYLQSTMICRDYKYPRNGKLSIADKERLLPIVVAVLLIIGSTYQNLFHYNHGPIWIWSFFILICFLFVLAEEMVFRNFIFYVLIKHKVKVNHAVLICSGLFACMHTFRYTDQSGPWVMAYHFVFAFLAGVTLGSLFVISRNVLMVTIISFLIRIPVFGYALNHTVLAGKKINLLLQYEFTATTNHFIWFGLLLTLALLVAGYYYRELVRHYNSTKRLSIPRIVYDPERIEYLSNRYMRIKKPDSGSMFF
jgi:membrane protease YdiL (CAAX protease family)